ncbi:MAG: VOC family protein [Chloroflexi bacterium]|nr:VOC family protein [Chloroflexota bacterium]
MRSLGYAEIAIVIADVERATEFYVGVVGYEVADVDVGAGGRIIKVGPDHFLGLWEPGVWGKSGLPFDNNYGQGFRSSVNQAHLVFAIHEDEIKPLKSRLNDAGYPTHGPETHGDGSLHLYANDPDGHPMEWWGKKPA